MEGKGSRRVSSDVTNPAMRAVVFVASMVKRLARRMIRQVYKRSSQVFVCCGMLVTTLIGKRVPMPRLTSVNGCAEPEGPKALILSLSPVFDDPRIRRQAVTLESEGWSVYLVGYEGRSRGSAKWNFIALDKELVRVRGRSNCLIPLSLLWSKFAETHYWYVPGNRYIWGRLNQSDWNLVIANDYPTVPLAAAIARVTGAAYVVDCHEYARAQIPVKGLGAKLRWTLFRRSYVDAINRRFLPGARAVSTVCDGIAELLYRDYGLVKRPAVIRSVPEYERHTFRPCSKTIRVLYHGAAVPSRGLEQAIDSIPMWRPEFKLCLRLVASEDYLRVLKNRTAKNEVVDRVEFLPPVPFTEMVTRAAEADIGYCVLENFSPQRQFTCPNKFFEYAMAGLAIVCSDLPELRKVGDRYGHCMFVDGYDSNEIARCINDLSVCKIHELKKNSLAAAEHLCWEREQRVMMDSYLAEPFSA